MKTQPLARRILKAITPNIFNGAKNEMKRTNTGLKKLIFGGETKDGCQHLGIAHLITGARFQNELLAYNKVSGNCSESAIRTMKAIQHSIPEGSKNSFFELAYFPEMVKKPIVTKLAKKADQLRYVLDKVVCNPTAKIKKTVAFVANGIKDLFHREKEVDIAYIKKLFPELRIPENLDSKGLRAFLIDNLKKCNYTDKEIKLVLKRRTPRFYRIVGEEEARALKLGHRMESTADYNQDMRHTDITTDPNYIPPFGNSAKYRVMFKRDEKFNPFTNGNTSPHDMPLQKWWLTGGYDFKDIVCIERINK